MRLRCGKVPVGWFLPLKVILSRQKMNQNNITDKVWIGSVDAAEEDWRMAEEQNSGSKRFWN